MRRAAGIAAVFTLLLAPAASAHPTLWPRFVEQGTATNLHLLAPNERRVPMTAVDLTSPPGVELLEARSAPPWRATLAGNRASWAGGKVEYEQWARLPLRLRAEGEPGGVELSVRQHFADGRSVDWQVALPVTPATQSAERRYGLAVAGGAIAVVVAASAAMLWALRRRRTLQEK